VRRSPIRAPTLKWSTAVGNVATQTTWETEERPAMRIYCNNEYQSKQTST